MTEYHRGQINPGVASLGYSWPQQNFLTITTVVRRLCKFGLYKLPIIQIQSVSCMNISVEKLKLGKLVCNVRKSR